MENIPRGKGDRMGARRKGWRGYGAIKKGKECSAG